jgi:hypothetical protein
VSLDASSTCGLALGAGASCTVVVRFAATGTFDRHDEVSVSAGGGKETVLIYAWGDTAGLVITPAIAAFASTPNVTSAPVAFTLTNASNVTVASPTFYIDGQNVADFNFGNGSCFNLAVLGPQVRCTIALVFTPTTDGGITRYANLTASSSGSNADGAIATLIGTVY